MDTMSDRLRRRAIEVVAAGPAAVAPAVAVIALLVGVAGILLLELGSAPGARPTENAIALWSMGALVLVGVAVLGASFARRRRANAAAPALPREPGAGDLLTAALLAAAVVLV